MGVVKDRLAKAEAARVAAVAELKKRRKKQPATKPAATDPKAAAENNPLTPEELTA